MSKKLLLPIRERDLEGIRDALKEGADPNAINSSKKTVLTMLCDNYHQHDNLEMMKILIEAGADLNIEEGEDGPLHYACMYGPESSALLLLDIGADPKRKGSYGRTPLHYAAVRFPSIVEKLIALGVDINAENEGKDTALFEAISRKEMPRENIFLLLDSGADLINQEKERILNRAASYGTFQSVEALLSRGLDPSLLGRWKRTAFHNACGSHIEGDAKVKAMVQSAKHIADEILDDILEYVAKQGDIPYLQTICDLSENGLVGTGALNRAAEKGNIPVMENLLRLGCSIEGKEPPILRAAYKGQYEAVRFLVEHGASCDVVDYRGNTPLIQAAWGGHLEVVSFLLAHGVDIDETNKYNWSSLMQAAVESKIEMAKFLLEKGARTDFVGNEQGETALSLALHRGNKEMIELFQQAGAHERSVTWRGEEEEFLSIYDCDICHFVPVHLSLGGGTKSRVFRGLNILLERHIKFGHSDFDIDRLLHCSNCGTLYHFIHRYHDYDAPISPPFVTHTINRLLPAQFEWSLSLVEKAPSKAFSQEDLIAETKARLVDPEQLIPSSLQEYACKILVEHACREQAWSLLDSELLLRHPNERLAFIALEAIHKLFRSSVLKEQYPKKNQLLIQEEHVRCIEWLERKREDFRRCVQDMLPRLSEHTAGLIQRRSMDTLNRR